ncbi:MAG TPA: alkaline phosphatase PafA [Flavobacteriaceae bacterium]|nr:alkaline phosphatase PafA [Flavobacteriaceae bacterium]
MFKTNFSFCIFISLLFTQLLLTSCAANQPVVQQENNSEEEDSIVVFTKPKLVVGIVVDQMRYDYLIRFWDRYGEDGFKRMVTAGYNLKNAHYNYMPTFTAPGHASIYTGTTPRNHGVIGNSFYDKSIGEKVVPVENDTVLSLGTEGDAGKRSPKYLLASTFGDENRLATQFRGKTIGIALKDRGAVLPAGHAANAAYWFYGDDDEGNFISSSYYNDELPNWVENFNNSGKIDSYIDTWETLYPISTYIESGPDDSEFEGDLAGQKTFPYDLEALKDDKYGYGILAYTPFGNSIVTDFSLAAIDGEQLGEDQYTDVLAISYSSPDYIGHKFGVNAKETQDNYLRLDQEIARLLKRLDEKVGKGNYTVFLTADHAGVHVPSYLQSKNISGGYFSNKELRAALRTYTEEKYQSDSIIAAVSNFQVFFNYEELKRKDINRKELEDDLYNFLLEYPKIAKVYTRHMLENSSFTDMIGERVKDGFNAKRSGDVAYVLEPSVISYPRYGSTHGSPYSYDAHVPMIFYGKGINKGQSGKYAEIIDIAPTISALLGISFPSASTGEVLYEVID